MTKYQKVKVKGLGKVTELNTFNINRKLEPENQPYGSPYLHLICKTNSAIEELDSNELFLYKAATLGRGQLAGAASKSIHFGMQLEFDPLGNRTHHNRPRQLVTQVHQVRSPQCHHVHHHVPLKLQSSQVRPIRVTFHAPMVSYLR